MPSDGFYVLIENLRHIQHKNKTGPFNLGNAIVQSYSGV